MLCLEPAGVTVPGSGLQGLMLLMAPSMSLFCCLSAGILSSIIVSHHCVWLVGQQLLVCVEHWKLLWELGDFIRGTDVPVR